MSIAVSNGSEATPSLGAHVERLDAVPTLYDLGERLYSPAGAAKACKIPGLRGGPHINGSTVWRWIEIGGRGKNGERFRLEAVRAGTRWLTSVEAIGRFIAKLTAASVAPDGAAGAAAAPTPKQRTRAAQAASAKADAIFGATN